MNDPLGKIVGVVCTIGLFVSGLVLASNFDKFSEPTLMLWSGLFVTCLGEVLDEVCGKEGGRTLAAAGVLLCVAGAFMIIA